MSETENGDCAPRDIYDVVKDMLEIMESFRKRIEALEEDANRLWACVMAEEE